MQRVILRRSVCSPRVLPLEFAEFAINARLSKGLLGYRSSHARSKVRGGRRESYLRVIPKEVPKQIGRAVSRLDDTSLLPGPEAVDVDTGGAPSCVSRSALV